MDNAMFVNKNFCPSLWISLSPQFRMLSFDATLPCAAARGEARTVRRSSAPSVQLPDSYSNPAAPQAPRIRNPAAA